VRDQVMIPAENLGVYVVAPALSTITAALVVWAGRTLYQTSKVQENLMYRVESNEEELENVKDNLAEIKAVRS